MLVVNSLFVIYYFVFGFCIGGWASIKTLVDKIHVLGIFVDCYQVRLQIQIYAQIMIMLNPRHARQCG